MIHKHQFCIKVNKSLNIFFVVIHFDETIDRVFFCFNTRAVNTFIYKIIIRMIIITLNYWKKSFFFARSSRRQSLISILSDWAFLFFIT